MLVGIIIPFRRIKFELVPTYVHRSSRGSQAEDGVPHAKKSAVDEDIVNGGQVGAAHGVDDFCTHLRVD